MAEIVIRGVQKSFGAFTALHSVDLTIADQEFMVLVGRRTVARSRFCPSTQGWKRRRRARFGLAASGWITCRRVIGA
jgi:ABC-type branched-subunit amino acid transport system ATPase component